MPQYPDEHKCQPNMLVTRQMQLFDHELAMWLLTAEGMFAQFLAKEGL